MTILIAATSFSGCEQPRARSFAPTVRFTGLVYVDYPRHFRVSIDVPTGYLRPSDDRTLVGFYTSPTAGVPDFLLNYVKPPQPDDSPNVVAGFQRSIENPCQWPEIIFRRRLPDGEIVACGDVKQSYRVVRILRIGDDTLRCESEVQASVPEVTRQEMVDVCMSLRATICIDEVTYPGDDCDKHIDTKLLVAPRSW